MNRDLGDFQTPKSLVRRILRTLRPIGSRWDRVLEPTCGGGNFIIEILNESPPPQEIKGIELQRKYVELAKKQVEKKKANTEAKIIQADFFETDLVRDLQWKKTGPLLVIGNPPWVTNSELGTLNSSNLPAKSNIKQLPGIAAITGESNFDIAEAIWMKLMCELVHEKQVTIALLCKTSVARNVIKFSQQAKLPMSNAKIYRINAQDIFRAAVDACFFRIDMGVERKYRAKVFESLESQEPTGKIGILRGSLVSNLDIYKKFSRKPGGRVLNWRQGVKHDASDVMELTYEPETQVLYNKKGERVEIEPNYLYPLVKSSDLYHERVLKPARRVIITQKRIGQDTRYLKERAPRLWNYLSGNKDVFNARKSTVYRNQPPFSIFGIGDYSFAPYKVAVSGFYKEVQFRLLVPVNEKPVMLDDTCYFLPFQKLTKAALITSVLNHPISLEFLESIIFKDSKRPVTKKLLQQLIIQNLLEYIDDEIILDIAQAQVENKKREASHEEFQQTLRALKHQPKQLNLL